MESNEIGSFEKGPINKYWASVSSLINARSTSRKMLLPRYQPYMLWRMKANVKKGIRNSKWQYGHGLPSPVTPLLFSAIRGKLHRKIFHHTISATVPSMSSTCGVAYILEWLMTWYACIHWGLLCLQDSPMRVPAEQFLSQRAFGAPPIVIALAAQGTFRGFKDTKTPLFAVGKYCMSKLWIFFVLVVN